MGGLMHYALCLLFILINTSATSFTNTDDGMISMHYILHANDNTDCIAISLYCGDQLISEADIFETSSETRVDFQIDPKVCTVMEYSFLKPSCNEWNIGTYITIFGRYDNVIYRFNGVLSDSYTGSFSTMYGFLSGDEWLRSVTTTSESSEYHFHKDFSVPMEFTAYELRIFFRGRITVVLNDRIIVKDELNSEWVAGDEHTYGLSFIRSGDELLNGSNSLKVFLVADSPPIIDGWMGLYYSPSDHYLYPYPMQFSAVPKSNLTDFTPLIDQNELTSLFFPPEQLFRIDFGFYRPSLTRVALFIPYDYLFTIHSLMITSSRNVVLSRPTFHSLHNKQYHSFLMKTDVYDGVSFHFVSTLGVSFYEMQFQIGRHSNNETVIFERDMYSFYKGFHPVTLYPVESLVGNCHPEEDNPMIMVDLHCVIRINLINEGVFPIILKNDHDMTVGNVTISVQICHNRWIRAFRFYGDNSIPSETVTMYDSNNHVVLSMNSRYPFNSEKAYMFLCLPPDVYRIVVNDFVKEAWLENSYFQLDEPFWGDYVFYMRFRFDRRLNTPTQWELDIRQSLPIGSSWYCYSQKTIPARWYDQSVDGWTFSTYNHFPQTEGQFQLFKRSLFVEDLNVNMMEIIVHYQSACMIVLNEKELYRYGILDEVISNSTVATDHSEKAVAHRIRVPVAIQSNENWIAIALIHYMIRPHSSSFDATIRFFLETKSLRMDDCSAAYTSTSGRNPGDLFIMDSWKRMIWLTGYGRTEHRVEWLPSNADYLNCIELQTSLTDTNRISPVIGPTVFSIEARQNKGLEYDLLFNSSSLYWPSSLTLQSFCFDPSKNYRSFRYYMDSQYSSFQVYSLLTYSVILPSSLTIEYESTSLVIGYFYVCIQPSTPFLSNFTVSGLPFGMGVDNGNGCLFGEVKTLEEPFTIVVTAYTASQLPIKSSILFTVTNCTDDRNLYILSLYSLSHDYTLIQWSIKDEMEATYLTGLMVASSQSISTLPICLANKVYSFTLSYNSTNTNQPVEAEVSVELYRNRHLFYTAYLSTSPNPFQFFINAELSLAPRTEWSYLATASVPSNWTDPSFDASEWQKAEVASILSTFRIVLLRKTIYLPHYRSYKGYSFYIHYTGGVALYLNGLLCGRYNINHPLSETSLPIIPYSTLQSTVLNINLVNTMHTDSITVCIFYSRQDNEYPLILDITGRASIDNESLLSSMSVFLLNEEMMTTLHNGIQSYYVLNMLSFPTIAFNWEFQNMETMPMNTLYLQTSAVENLLITLYCSNYERNEGLYLLYRYRLTHTHYQFSRIPVDKALLPCNQYTVLLSGDSLTHYSFKIYQIYLYYDLTYQDAFCGRAGDIVAVKENHISPTFCMNQHGYMYTTCIDGQFTPISSEHCYTQPPSSFEYPVFPKSIAIGTSIPDIVPHYSGVISHFFTYNKLPDGLQLDPTTGILSGSIHASAPAKQTIRIFGNNGNNTHATVSTLLELDYTFYTCPKEGIWESNQTVSHFAVFSCSMGNHGIGITRKHCSITYNEAIWDYEEMSCVSQLNYFRILFSSFVAISLVPSLFRLFIRLFKRCSKKEI